MMRNTEVIKYKKFGMEQIKNASLISNWTATKIFSKKVGTHSHHKSYGYSPAAYKPSRSVFVQVKDSCIFVE